MNITAIEHRAKYAKITDGPFERVVGMAIYLPLAKIQTDSPQDFGSAVCLNGRWYMICEPMAAEYWQKEWEARA